MAITSILSSAVAGLHKSAERVHESANKIVNLNTKSQISEPVSAQPPLTGSNAVQAQIIGGNSDDLVREFVNLIEAEIAYRANAAVIRTAEDLSKTSRDILA